MGLLASGRRLDDRERAGLPGSFVDLSHGKVHYDLQGPEKGPPVVLVHGFSTPMFIWDQTAEALAAEGFRVLRFDLYGRGFSDRPDTPNNEDLFVGQASELISALNLPRPVNLVGLSMGGAISTLFCSRFPGDAAKLALIAPAGYPVNLPLAARLVALPLLGELLMNLLGGKVIEKGAKMAFFDPRLAGEEFQAKFREQTRFSGYRKSLLSTIRHFDLNDQAEAFEAVGRQGRDVLLVWGREDAIVPYENHKRVLAAMPGAEFLSVPRAGHAPHVEAPGTVLPRLADFLKGP